jgi:ribosomal protein S18 acetylase RimI-like enzyme
MQNRPTFRPVNTADLPALLTILPQLADFEVPDRRDSNDLWQGDADLLKKILDGNAPESFAEVAVDHGNVIAGFIMVTLRPELLSHEPSAHLEALVVAPDARNQGLGRQLLHHAHTLAKAAGAESMTLHVFANNTRARALYQSDGYDSELIRAIKWLD